MSVTLLAIDPGKHWCDCAWFYDGELTRVYAMPSLHRTAGPALHGLSIPANRVICEKPQLDGRPATDLIDVTLAGAYLAGQAWGTVRFVEPREWKGSMPKPVHHRKVWQTLTPTERAALPDYAEHEINKALLRGAKDGWRKPGGTYYRGERGKVHNALDAVALGLFELGRLVVV